MKLRPRSALPRHVTAVALTVLSATVFAQDASAPRAFDLAPAPLDETLARFGAQTGLMIAVDSRLTDGIRSPGVRGVHTPGQALTRLLAGTGLDARLDDGRYVIRPAAASATPVTLAAIDVSGGVDAVTEGTRSYVAPVSRGATGLALAPRDTPQSISIVTRQRLDDMGMNKLAEVMSQTTGIVVQENDTERITFSSRGYGISNFQVDGVLNTYSSIGGKNTDMVVYDRVEVIRGATGLTTGAGDPSASINLVRKRPTATLSGNAALLLGSWNLRRVEADVGGPLALDGRVRGRLVVADERRDSFRDFYKMNKKVAYGVIEADLGDRTVLTAGYEYQKQRPTAPSWGTVLYWGWDPVAAKSYLVDFPRSTNLSAKWSTWAPTEATTFARLEHRLGEDWTLRGTYSHSTRDVDTDLWFGYGGTPRPDGTGMFAASTSGRFEETMRVADINAAGSVSLFGRRHDLSLGYTSNLRRGVSEASDWDDMPADWNVVKDWRNWTGDVARPSVRWLGRADSVSRLEQSAAYAAAKFSIANPLRAVLGGRYSDWRTDTVSFGEDGRPSSRKTYSHNGVFTPYAGVLYDMLPNTTVYASYTDIFKPQDYRDRNNAYLDPIVGANYELGAKSELLDGDLLIAAALFRGKQDNVAELDDSVPANFLPDGASAYRSIGKGNKVRGWEIEATGRLTPAWNLSAGLSQTDARNAAGQRINTTISRTLARVFTTYRLNGPLEGLTVGGGVTWQSAFYRDVRNARPVAQLANGSLRYAAERMTQPSFALLNLMASYEINRHFTAALNVNNVFDKHYYRNVGFYSGVHWGDPRSVQLTLRGKF